MCTFDSKSKCNYREFFTSKIHVPRQSISMSYVLFFFLFFCISNSFLKYCRTKATSAAAVNGDGRASGNGSTVNVPSKKIVTPLPPLIEPIRDLPPVQYATVRPELSQTQVTTLSNGLRVASEKRFGQFCTIGGKALFLMSLNNKLW